MTAREKVLIWCLVGVAVVSGGYMGYTYRSQIKEFFVPTPIAVSTTTTTATSGTTASEVTITPVTDPGVTWQTPTLLADLNLFTSSITSNGAVAYYQIGKDKTGDTIILAITSPQSMGGGIVARFKESADGKYYFLQKESGDLGSDPAGFLVNYNTKTFLDLGYDYASLNPPTALPTKIGIIMVGDSILNAPSTSDANQVKVTDSAYGPVYKSITAFDANSDLSTRNITLKLVDTTTMNYDTPIPFMADDTTINLTKTDGTKISDKYTKNILGGGCGRGGTITVVPSFNLDTRSTLYGTTIQGDKLYLLNSSDKIISALYNNFGYKDSTNPKVTLAQFTAATQVLVWPDPIGDYEIFVKSTYQPLGECGKPVIYLYPQKSEQVSVKVGANITKSEPAYNLGWSVLADPSGNLTLNGQNYPYLFWEGKGDGTYPEINQGFVVKQAELINAMTAQLHQLGLNEKETADFMQFWLPKMPATPFVRLTWFGTAQMNKLAPLSISPKPDTIIRFFLDSEGLEAPINLPAQVLNAPKRSGFTVVEWGGLLR